MNSKRSGKNRAKTDGEREKESAYVQSHKKNRGKPQQKQQLLLVTGLSNVSTKRYRYFWCCLCVGVCVCSRLRAQCVATFRLNRNRTAQLAFQLMHCITQEIGKEGDSRIVSEIYLKGKYYCKKNRKLADFLMKLECLLIFKLLSSLFYLQSFCIFRFLRYVSLS